MVAKLRFFFKVGFAASVDRIRVRTLDGHEFFVKSRRYVLACGGIENARILLLASNSVVSAGLGNRHGLVGRFFMDHPSGPAYPTLLWFPAANQALDAGKGQGLAFGLPPKIQAEKKILNVVLHAILPRHPPVRADIKKLRGLRLTERILSQLAGSPETLLSPCRLRSEHASLPESRVTLHEEKDALGVPRVSVDARPGELNRHTLVTALDLFGRALAKSGLGRLYIPPDPRPDGGWQGTSGTNHQMGTTRMSEYPDQGVVNSDQRVFDLSNLYIAGSSTFPAVGFMNPTFTITATTLRLADHLKASVT